MEAANRGANEAGSESVGLNIVLPVSSTPTPTLHRLFVSSFITLPCARCTFCFGPGLWSLSPVAMAPWMSCFETLTLIQTGKIQPLPVLLFGRDYWEKLIDFDFLVEEGMISSKDLGIFQFVDDIERAWEIIRDSLEKD